MTRPLQLACWGLAFVIVGLLAAMLGRWSGQQSGNLDLWCEGESAHQVPAHSPPAWLATRFRLDLHPQGLSAMRMAARLIDADSGAELGTLHRQSTFTVQQQGPRLQINVVNAAKGETDGADARSPLALFIFKPESNLSYWIRPLAGERYLIDDGNDIFLVCSRR